MHKISTILLKSKFRGCLFGSLIGDCYGAPFEGEKFTSGTKVVLQKYFDKLEGQYFKAPVKKYTKDTNLTRCIAQCLITHPSKLEPANLARSFVKEFISDPRRGYGEHIIDVFDTLRANKFADPFKPAMEHLNISNSLDNGAAVRISPVALFYCKDYKTMLKNARSSIELTHTHKEGVTGGLLQCATIHECLTLDPTTKLDIFQFSSKLIDKLKEFETDDEGLGIGNPTPFKVQLEVVQELLSNARKIEDMAIVDKLGFTSTALYSVPAAIFCFLRAISDIENIKTSNPFRRTLQYAISLGGDTDAIASMAGSIAGSYYGEEQINKSMLKHCEAGDQYAQLADELYDQSIKANR